jgi:HEAT repeat protein
VPAVHRPSFACNIIRIRTIRTDSFGSRKSIPLYRLRQTIDPGSFHRETKTKTVATPMRPRKRRMFGPLFYSTLVVAAICLVYFALLRYDEMASRASYRSVEQDLAAGIASAIVSLNAESKETRVEGVNSLYTLLQRCEFGDDRSELRNRGVSALRAALGDPLPSVRAAAASALGCSARTALPARSELTKALGDEDLNVRIVAARVLLGLGGDAKDLVLRVLAEIVTDPASPRAERVNSLSVMVGEGKEGQTAAVAAFVRRLSNVEPRVGWREAEGASYLEWQMLWPALEPRLSSDSRRRRTTAALAAILSWRQEAKNLWDMGPNGAPTSGRMPIQTIPKTLRPAIALLEKAVSDKELEFDLRELVLYTLLSTGPRNAVHRCGIALAHQLEDPDSRMRVAAAKLLQLIDPETLAGINMPDETE